MKTVALGQRLHLSRGEERGREEGGGAWTAEAEGLIRCAFTGIRKGGRRGNGWDFVVGTKGQRALSVGLEWRGMRRVPGQRLCRCVCVCV
jgi:hypothetical protein